MSVLSFSAHKVGRCTTTGDPPQGVMQLPVAPQVVARTRFSPPPPSFKQSLTIPEGMALLDRTMEEKGSSVSMVAITGPGDPLATPDITLEAIEQVHSHYPELPIGLKTHGIGSKQLAGDLARLGVQYIEMQVDAVRAEILEKLYAWIRPGSKTLKISDAVNLLIEEQRNGVPALKFHNLTVSILTTLYPGHNIDHVPKISATMMELGAKSISLLPYTSEPGVEVSLATPTPSIVKEAAGKAGTHLPVVQPRLYEAQSSTATSSGHGFANLPQPSAERPNIAVASSNGMEVDLHLGQAKTFLIYGPREDGLTCLLETRDAPASGSGAGRWQQVSTLLSDCALLLAASAGETPRQQLAKGGLSIYITEENIEGMIDVLYGGGKKGKKKK